MKLAIASDSWKASEYPEMSSLWCAPKNLRLRGGYKCMEKGGLLPVVVIFIGMNELMLLRES